jgi:uncharacterized protein (DUF362 family)
MTLPPDFENRVAVRTTEAISYPQRPPFDPPRAYPELGNTGIDPSNGVYDSVRQLLADLGLDATRQGTALWNPFGDFIDPGMTVFIKPNTVIHEHEKRRDLFSILVHPSVIRPVLDYVCKALQDDGTIVVGDSQLYSSDYDKMLARSGLGGFLEWYKSRTKAVLQWFDLRLNKAKRTWLYGRWARAKIECDPLGYGWVDLADRSRFVGIDPARLRIAIAGHNKMIDHHGGGRHRYLFPRSFLRSDVVINIAKLKTHRRTAVTLALKNYMGLPALKDSLPHFRTGSPQEGGDQYIHPSRRKRVVTRLHDTIQTTSAIPLKFACAVLKKIIWNSRLLVPFKDDVFEAMWWGNDTVWRTLHDLNRAVRYADKQGLVQPTLQRRQFVIIDGIIGGEGDGPLACDPVPAGLLLAGANPACVDAAAATAMGFDAERIPVIRRAFEDRSEALPLAYGKKEDIKIIADGREEAFSDFAGRPHLRFRPHPQWAGHVELSERR